jgi:hypothetical protein
MGIAARDWVRCRRKIQEWLLETIPDDISSKNLVFERLTGLRQSVLGALWAKGGMLTSCNSRAGKMAQGSDVPGASILTNGLLDISQAAKEVWVAGREQTAATPA